jgi:hypothetical protein
MMGIVMLVTILLMLAYLQYHADQDRHKRKFRK